MIFDEIPTTRLTFTCNLELKPFDETVSEKPRRYGGPNNKEKEKNFFTPDEVKLLDKEELEIKKGPGRPKESMNKPKNPGAEQRSHEMNLRSRNPTYFVLMVGSINNEPCTYEEALNHPSSNEWIKAMDDEYKSLMENKTWNLVELPEGHKSITSKWVYKMKRNLDGTLRYKARLVDRDFSL